MADKLTVAAWEEDPDNNDNVGGILISEGNYQPSNVNNSVRELMSQVASFTGADTLDSAVSSDLSTVEGQYVVITNTTTITAFGTAKAGWLKIVKFSGALTLTHNGTSLILPGGANITTAAGDVFAFVSEGSGNWRCVGYMLANGLPIAFIDEDTMASNSAVKVPSQQSVKAYVDTTAKIQLQTAVATTSGTSIDVTGIPSGVKRITIQFLGVSTNGASTPVILIGDAGGVENTGYEGSSIASGQTTGIEHSAAFWLFSNQWAATHVVYGTVTLILLEASSFTWSCVSQLSDDNAFKTAWSSGAKALSAELDRIRLTTSGGTNTFDAGSIVVSWEF